MLDKLLNEAIAVHEALRRLGVAPEHLFLSVYPDGLAVEVRSVPPEAALLYKFSTGRTQSSTHPKE